MKSGTLCPGQVDGPVSAPEAPLCAADVALVTLTYADRVDLLAQCVAGVEAQGVRRVLVFANGLAPDPAARLAALAQQAQQRGLQVEVIHSSRNVGSASGYGALMARARDTADVRAIWFLDDDNVPQPGALPALLAQAAAHPGAALCALRTDRSYLLRTAETGRAIPPAPGEVFGVDIAKRLRRLWHRALSGARQGQGVPEAVAVPRVPYGGLFVPAAAYRGVAGPRADFVIYADDYEYSARLSASAGLYLVGAARIDDLEASWNATGKAQQTQPAKAKSQTTRLMTMPPDFRLYYVVRNTVYLDRQRLTALSWPLFGLNLGVLLIATGAQALRRGRGANFAALLAALRDGIRGRLGLNPRFPLP